MKNTFTILSQKQRARLSEHIGGAFKIIKQILLLELEGNQKQAKKLVISGIAMKGMRLWFLLTSCLIASIGLNTNNSAVIIGAMLISPLMGPILGLGYGLATASRRLIQSSIQNFLFAVFLTLAVASLYFLISPFQDSTPEIMARTAPNLLDLLVAIAAAFAGVIALNSTSLAGAVPGVAIATAIMPPLCASAYGIAHGNWRIALGGFYLFFVNAVAITVVAFLLLKRMHFSHDLPDSSENGRFRPAYVTIAVLLVVAPLCWNLWDAWRDNFENRSISRLVQSYKEKLEIVSWQWDATKRKKLVLYNFKKADPELRSALDAGLKKISSEASLEFHETAASPEMAELAAQFRTSQLSALVSNPKIVEGLMKLASSQEDPYDLPKELLIVEAELSSLTDTRDQSHAYLRTKEEQTEILVVIKTKSKSEKNRIYRESPRYEQWLKTRLPSKFTIKFEVL